MYKVEYAISVSLAEREGLWKITFPHPLDTGKPVRAWIPRDVKDKRIGSIIDKIRVTTPGTRLLEVLALLEDSISKYPYEWPWAGDSLNPFSHDFEVQMDVRLEDNVSQLEMSELAYLTAIDQVGKQPPDVTEDTLNGLDKELLPAGGSYVKLQITFDRAKPVSEISLDPFCEYPIEVMSISYEEEIDTFHPRKELSFREKEGASLRTMIFKFPTVLAKRFTVVLRQENYKRQSYDSRVLTLAKQSLWNADAKTINLFSEKEKAWKDDISSYVSNEAKQEPTFELGSHWQSDKNEGWAKQKETIYIDEV